MIKDKAKPKTLVPKAGLPPSVGEELKEAHEKSDDRKIVLEGVEPLS